TKGRNYRERRRRNRKRRNPTSRGRFRSFTISKSGGSGGSPGNFQQSIDEAKDLVSFLLEIPSKHPSRIAESQTQSPAEYPFQAASHGQVQETAGLPRGVPLQRWKLPKQQPGPKLGGQTVDF